MARDLMSVQAEKKGALIYAQQQTTVLSRVLYHRKNCRKNKNSQTESYFTLYVWFACMIPVNRWESALQVGSLKCENLNYPETWIRKKKRLETHLWGSRCIQDELRQLPKQFVEGVLHVAAGQNWPAQVSQEPGRELPLAGFSLQGQRHSQRRHLAPQGA